MKLNAIRAGINFDLTWTDQPDGVVSNAVLAVKFFIHCLPARTSLIMFLVSKAEEEFPFLKRYALNWAAGRILRQIVEGRRGYISDMSNPNSSRYQAQLLKSEKFRQAHERKVAAGLFTNKGPLGEVSLPSVFIL